ncbi:MAG TPA: ribonuclease Y [Acidobacteriota bacterium]|nr:ribonuclease Y [Acidobacteriota bacterium]
MSQGFITGAGSAAGLAALAIIAWFFMRGRLSTQEDLSEARSSASRLIEEGERQAAALLKEARIEGREQLHVERQGLEAESRERRQQVLEAEARVHERQESLERRANRIDERERKLKHYEERLLGMERDVNLLREEAAQRRDEAVTQLERAAHYNREDAKAQLVRAMTREAKEEGARQATRIIEDAKTNANREANRVVATAIQRCARNHVAENTVSVVALPSDDMKGRVIGREGRNIRAFEMMTGVNLIVDDTPEAVLISSFDPFRREIAKLALERLVSDGRIHPGRIEEVVQRVREKIEEQILVDGTSAAAEIGIHDMAPELLRLLGMLKFRTSYGQNVLCHSVEVATISGIIAAELGANDTVARRGGLLHDVGKAVDQEVEGTHLQIGIRLLRKYGESKDVVHAMEAHHFDVEPATVEAVVVQAADALSAARPGARRDMLETYVKRLQKLEQIADSFRGVAKSYAIQAGRELRIIVESSKVSDIESIWLSRDIANRVQREVQYPGEIKVTVIRETRAVEIAH